MTKTVRLEGMKEVKRALKQLPAKVNRQIANNALRAGARVMRNYAQMVAPFETGLLTQAITVRTTPRRYVRRPDETHVVLWANAQLRYAGGSRVSAAQVAYWQQWGTLDYFARRRAKRTRRLEVAVKKSRRQTARSKGKVGVKPTFFMSDAFRITQMPALGAITSKVKQDVDKHMSKELAKSK